MAGAFTHTSIVYVCEQQTLWQGCATVQASLQLKTMSLNIAQQFMKEMVKIYFGLLKIQVKFLIN